MSNSFQGILAAIIEINKEFLETFAGLEREELPTRENSTRSKWIEQYADGQQTWQKLIADTRRSS